MTDKLMLTEARKFLSGNNFSIDWLYNRRTMTDEKVIAYEVDGLTDYIKVKSFLNMIERDNQHL